MNKADEVLRIMLLMDGSELIDLANKLHLDPGIFKDFYINRQRYSFLIRNKDKESK